MLLFNSHEGGLTGRNLKPSNDEASPLMQEKQSLFATLTGGEEHPRLIGGLMLILVVLLHIGVGLWLLKPAEPPKPPAPMVMEVSLLSTPAQKAEVTPPAPPKPEPPKKQPAKQPVKKKTPVIPKQAELPKPQPIIAEEKPAPSNPAPVPSVPVPQPQPPVSRPAPAVVNSEPRISTGVVPLERVPPKYPARAANRHIEGWVKIEFTITTSGTVENAIVVEAEPAEIFDEAALKAINQWTFKEKIVNGVAVEQRAVQTLQFKLTQ